MNDDTTAPPRVAPPLWATPGLALTRLRPYEREAARLAGVPGNRRALFADGLTGPGISRLWSLLESGRYEIHAPEEAALLCVAWLLRADRLDAAAELAALLDPFADRLPFTPRPEASGPEYRGPGTTGPEVTGPAREAARLLARQRPNRAVAAQREALTVWRPFEDELLSYWLRAYADGARAPRPEGAALLERYGALAAAHPLTGRHRDPKSNAAILRRALEERVAGRELSPREAGLLRRAVASMVAKRGRPGSPEHTLLRQEQVRQAALLRGPLAGAEGNAAIPGAEPPAALAAAEEARAAWQAGLSAVRVPHAVGAALARGYHPEVADPALRTLLAKLYQGAHRFYHHLQDFTRLAERPWIRAVAGAPVREPVALGAALRRLADFALEASAESTADLSPPLVTGLSALAREAGVPASFAVEPFGRSDLGIVTTEVLSAARVAAELMGGTPYERYHGIDYATVRDMAESDDREGFVLLCSVRAGRREPGVPFADGTYSPEVTAYPSVIEQVRILTACNLATLVHEIGAAPRSGWDALARAAFTGATRRRMATPKRTARAWRHLLFHLSMCDADQRAAVLAWIDTRTARLPAGTAARLAPPVAELRRAMA
ncbi:hypothetical protein J7F03_26685 [Streptomyces sp. ISL-43]|uniref:hypothetical protein n=1 Tax=Streptomyces sp. ISL-43 TaxID=2819183 RepID=UPI001BEAF48A|nr:hypothetical protein [Streptomyces sp. ISL-43]MBT2450597.1 hypothetical protein [Streptomyces sp. ISL-43]